MCPIIKSIMMDPVATVDGHAYEKAAIELWFARFNETSPVTHLKLSSLSLIPNLPLKKLIVTFLESHGVVWESGAQEMKSS